MGKMAKLKTQFKEGGNKTTNTINPESTNPSIFDRFKKIEEEKEKVKNLIVKKNDNVEKLKEVFKEYLEWCKIYSWLPWEKYKKALKLIKEKRINCTSKDIEEFSLELIAFEAHEKFERGVGVFLSVLINSSKDEEFIIHTEHLKKRIHLLGYKNMKKMIIYGNAGCAVGREMTKNGEIYLNGDYENISVLYWGKIYHKGGLLKKQKK
jgi:hypothetical protein